MLLFFSAFKICFIWSGLQWIQSLYSEYRMLEKYTQVGHQVSLQGDYKGSLIIKRTSPLRCILSLHSASRNIFKEVIFNRSCLVCHFICRGSYLGNTEYLTCRHLTFNCIFFDASQMSFNLNSTVNVTEEINFSYVVLPQASRGEKKSQNIHTIHFGMCTFHYNCNWIGTSNEKVQEIKCLDVSTMG